jgi:hypothetical protein
MTRALWNPILICKLRLQFSVDRTPQLGLERPVGTSRCCLTLSVSFDEQRLGFAVVGLARATERRTNSCASVRYGL